MNFNWINKKNNKKLILFMNGWGMDESAVNHLEPTNFDVLEINDYRNINTNIELNFEEYNEKYLVAWSMGVYVSNFFKDYFKDFDKKIALSGTNKIIDNSFGIPVKIYNCTVKFFNIESADKFIRSMFLNDNKNFKINRSNDELKEELIAIQNLKLNYELKYDKAIIPMKDNIVPYKNQLNYWENTDTEITQINSGHYIFNNFRAWQDIIC